MTSNWPKDLRAIEYRQKKEARQAKKKRKELKAKAKAEKEKQRRLNGK